MYAGGIWDNLHRAGRIGDPLYRDNDVVYKNLTTGLAGGWTFDKKFDIPSGMPAISGADATVFLEFAGIQGLANISLNGKALQSTDNMFRLYRISISPKLLKMTANTLSVHLSSIPPPVPFNGQDPRTVHGRDEADAWGWDWSPSLNPMSIYGGVRLVGVTNTLYLSSFSPQISTKAVDQKSQLPTKFFINASIELIAPPTRATLTGTLKLIGDWGTTTTIPITIPPAAATTTTVIHAGLNASVPDIQLWWPIHYGEPHLHNLTVQITWGITPAQTITATKSIGFRSVHLYTGPVPAPAPPTLADPSHQNQYLGCFRDGNPYWGCAPDYSRTCQHALPHLAGDHADMTVKMCLGLCAASGKYTLAGLQDGTKCYCGTEIGGGG